MSELDNIKKTEWFKNIPESIQKLVCEFPPASSVRLKSTGQTAYVYSWAEDNTITVIIDPNAKENKHIPRTMTAIYQVFGIKIKDLEFLHENSRSFALFLGRRMQVASDNAAICGECSQPKIPGYACQSETNTDKHEACAYQGGYCCLCATMKELGK